MMLSEWSQKILQNGISIIGKFSLTLSMRLYAQRSQDGTYFSQYWQFHRTPRVGTPVNQTGAEIRSQYSKQCRHHYFAYPLQPEVFENEEQVDDYERDADVDADNFLSTFTCKLKKNYCIIRTSTIHLY